MLECDKISKSFDGKTVIKDLSFTFPEKGLCLLMGRSGSGKTTLLRLLAGLEKPDRGTVRGTGNAAVCFQEYRLFPQCTALENVRLLAFCQKDTSGKECPERMLAALGFSKTDMQLKPSALSGGMKQRVSLARALCADASVLLLDEPLKELDAGLKKKALSLIIRRAENALVIMTAHDTLETEAAVDIVLDASRWQA